MAGGVRESPPVLGGGSHRIEDASINEPVFAETAVAELIKLINGR